MATKKAAKKTAKNAAKKAAKKLVGILTTSHGFSMLATSSHGFEVSFDKPVKNVRAQKDKNGKWKIGFDEA